MALNAVFPRNSPEEEAWLDKEIAGSGDLPTRALGRRATANFTDDCRYYARSYREGNAQLDLVVSPSAALPICMSVRAYGVIVVTDIVRPTFFNSLFSIVTLSGLHKL